MFGAQNPLSSTLLFHITKADAQIFHQFLATASNSHYSALHKLTQRSHLADVVLSRWALIVLTISTQFSLWRLRPHHSEGTDASNMAWILLDRRWRFFFLGNLVFSTWDTATNGEHMMRTPLVCWWYPGFCSRFYLDSSLFGIHQRVSWRVGTEESAFGDAF